MRYNYTKVVTIDFQHLLEELPKNAAVGWMPHPAHVTIRKLYKIIGADHIEGTLQIHRWTDTNNYDMVCTYTSISRIISREAYYDITLKIKIETKM